MSTEGVEALFVYGTLMPGHLRWSMLEPVATATAAATVDGTLWDTGNGWPAATFTAHRTDPGARPARRGAPDAGGDVGRTIPGWWVRIAAEAMGPLLVALDEMEGIGVPPDPELDPYVRVVVDVADRGPAWAYHAPRREPSWRRIPRWTGEVEA